MYFSGFKNSVCTISDSINSGFSKGETKNLNSDYFTATCYKKGTLHLTFKDEDMLRMFNVMAGKAKKWLPDWYGDKDYSTMSKEERQVVDSFEGECTYTKNLGKKLLSSNMAETLMLPKL